MDLLVDVFKQAGLKTRLLHQRSFYSDAALKFPCNKSIGFHVAVQGEAFIQSKLLKKSLHLKNGDIALMARGHEHIVSTEEKISNKLLSKAEFVNEYKAEQKNSGKSRLSLVSGAYQFWNEPIHPFFKDLPDWYIIRSEDIENFDSLQITLNLLSREISLQELGSENIVSSLLDIMFSFIMRRIVESKAVEPKTWGFAMNDSQIKKAIELLHTDCAKAWSLDELAKQVGLSRAGFAQKFKKTLGDTPLSYLTTVRMQKAMELLSSGDDNIETIANAVGYSDAFSFSKVFKKKTGLPPREFRLRDIEDRKSARRF